MDAAFPMPKSHPWAGHPWNHGKEGKRYYLMLKGIEPGLVDESNNNSIKQQPEEY